MTKRQLALYRRRRAKIQRMAKKMTQAEVARRLKMTPTRVNQILAEIGARPKDSW